jgi:hypothetical protein
MVLLLGRSNLAGQYTLNPPAKWQLEKLIRGSSYEICRGFSDQLYPFFSKILSRDTVPVS